MLLVLCGMDVFLLGMSDFWKEYDIDRRWGLYIFIFGIVVIFGLFKLREIHLLRELSKGKYAPVE